MESIHSDNAPQAIGPYSQAIKANGFIFCSGQVGRIPGTKTISPDVAEQTHQIMKNLSAVLHAGGSSLDQVVKTTIFLINIEDFAKVNEAYAQYFTKSKPARATIAVKQLPKGDLIHEPLVEVEAIAVAA